MTLFLLDRSPARRFWGTLRRWPAKVLVALCAWAVLATPVALVPGVAARTVTGYAETVLMALILASSLRDVADVERIAGSFFAVVVVYSAVILARFTGRFAGLYFYDGNDFATLAVMAIPLGIHFVTTRRPWPGRLAAAAGFLPLTAAFVQSQSRGGFLALVAVMAFLLLRPSALPGKWRAAVAAGVVLMLGVTATGAFWARMRTTMDPGQDYNVTGEFGRIDVWKRGAGYMAMHPLLGVGPGNFPEAEGRYAAVVREREELDRGTKWSAPHDIYVQVGSELGVPGLLLFIAVLVTGIRAAIRPAPDLDAASAGLGQALGAALLGFAVGGAFLSLAYVDAPYVVYAMAMGRKLVWAPLVGATAWRESAGSVA